MYIFKHFTVHRNNSCKKDAFSVLCLDRFQYGPNKMTYRAIIVQSSKSRAKVQELYSIYQI